MDLVSMTLLALHLPLALGHAGLVSGLLPALRPPVLAASGVTDIWSALDKIKGFFDTLFTHFLPIGLSACGCWYGWGGLQHIFSGGSPDQVRKAKATWWHATVGVAGVILATPLVNTIHTMFG